MEYIDVKIKDIIRELAKKKDLYRILHNTAVSNLEVSGDIIDLGSKSNDASYNRFLKFKTPYKITYTDFYHESKDIVKLNLEERFQINDSTYDCIMCFNVLEHIYNFQNVVSESYRILKDGGVFIGTAPFLVRFHPDPHDFFRYTNESIEKVFNSNGFKTTRLIQFGSGPFCAAYTHIEYILPYPLKVISIIIAKFLDMLIKKIKPSLTINSSYPLGFLFVFKK